MAETIHRRRRGRRIDIRVTDTQDAAIREAAALAGETLSAFLLTAAEQRASELLEGRRHLVMSHHSFEQFCAVVEQPGAAIPELQELFTLAPIPRA